MGIHFFYDHTTFQLRKGKPIKEWVKNVVSGFGKEVGEINIIFVGKQKIQEINEQFLKHFYPTDIITFNDNQDNTINGELYICPEVVKENAVHYKEFFYIEIRRVIIHGILHLLGHDDTTSGEADKMRDLENSALNTFPKE